MSLSSVCLGTGSLVRVGAVVLFAAPMLVATACNNDTVLPDAAAYSVQLVLREPSVTLAQNDTVSIDTAVAVVANNDTVPNPSLTLTSLDPTFVTVDGADVIAVSPTPAGQLARVTVAFQDVNNNTMLTDTAAFAVTAAVAPPPPRVVGDAGMLAMRSRSGARLIASSVIRRATGQ